MAEEQKGPKRYAKTDSVKTYHVGRSIAEIVKKEKVVPTSIDFDIRKVNTYVKEPGSKDFDSLNEFHLKHLYDESYLLSEKLQITQEYIVKFKPAQIDPNFNIVISVSTDSYKTMAKATVRKSSVIAKDPDLAKKLLEFFNKVKLKNNMLVGILEKDLLDGVKKLANLINSEGKLKEDFPIWLAKWKKPVMPFNDKIDLIYREKNKKKIKETDKVDHAERHFMIGVKSGELLVEYYKARKGKVGRGYNGKFISVDEPKIDNLPSFEPDPDTVEIEDTPEKKIYKAKQEGFINIDRGLLKVSREMELKNINLKETGNVKPGVDSQVKIIVRTGDAAEDAVGPDMVIEASEIEIIGSVGAGAVLRGKKVSIKGQTHSTTKIYADEANINVLKGTAYTGKATIKSFENARIYGCNIEIEQVFGGHLFGKRVDIKEVRAPCEVRAAHAIVIDKLGVGENKFFIDQTAILSVKGEIEKAKQLIKDSNKYLKEGTEELISVSKYIRDNKQSFTQLKTAIMDAKKRGEAPKPAFVKMFKEYLAKMKELDNVQKNLEQSEINIESSQLKLEQFDTLMKKTFIFNEFLKWPGRNEVHFIYHGKVYDADKTMENMPSVEMIAVKEKEKQGLVATIGMKEDFPNIDTFEECSFNYKCEPLLMDLEEKKEPEEKEEKEKTPKKKVEEAK